MKPNITVRNRKFWSSSPKQYRWQTWLKIGNQEYPVGSIHKTKDDAYWYAAKLKFAISQVEEK